MIEAALSNPFSDVDEAMARRRRDLSSLYYVVSLPTHPNPFSAHVPRSPMPTPCDDSYISEFLQVTIVFLCYQTTPFDAAQPTPETRSSPSKPFVIPCFSWFRLDRSSALTPEPMRISTTESSTHSSALATLTRLALLPRKLTVGVRPPLTNKGGSFLTLMLLFLIWFGPSPRTVYPPSNPFFKSSKPMNSFFRLSPHLVWPRLGLYFTLANPNVLISFSSLESSYLPRLVVMVIVWFWFSLPQSLANRLARWFYVTNLISKSFGLTPLLKCFRVLMPMIRIVMFLSITTPIAPFNFVLAGRGLHANRMSKRVKKNAIMIPSPRSGGYRSFFNSLPPYPPITKLLQGKAIRLKSRRCGGEKLPPDTNGIFDPAKRSQRRRSLFSIPYYFLSFMTEQGSLQQKRDRLSSSFSKQLYSGGMATNFGSPSRLAVLFQRESAVLDGGSIMFFD
ncbi:unnamed protein product [Arabidopsis thaliana]|uniref:Emb/CAB69836.1 n=1 Tax=Arabidopsis thaliana TaxID=3702 RepID=Q9FKH2_ARATH|nr:unnamed protein product [Arabidopsis thaliana]